MKEGFRVDFEARGMERERVGWLLAFSKGIGSREMHRVTSKKLFRPAGQVRSGTATTAAAVAAKWQQQPEVMVECGNNNNGGERTTTRNGRLFRRIRRERVCEKRVREGWDEEKR